MTVPAPPSNETVIAAIRVNIVFEKMIVSVLTVAGIAGATHFVIGLGARIFAGSFSFAGLANAVIGALAFTSLFFLAGFATAAAIGIPMFRILESAKLRKIWPYCLAAFAVSFAALAAIGLAPSIEAPARALYMVPGVAAAILFGRKMRPFWRAAERADAAAQSVLRLN